MQLCVCVVVYMVLCLFIYVYTHQIIISNSEHSKKVTRSRLFHVACCVLSVPAEYTLHTLSRACCLHSAFILKRSRAVREYSH